MYIKHAILWRIGVILTISSGLCAGTYSGGSGTPEDPYRIATVDDWQELIGASADWGKYFVLLNDIDFVGNELTPVESFSGIFDGNGHALRNAFINLPGNDFVGIFGSVNGGLIHNLGVENISVTGNWYVGGLVGSNQEGSISYCYTTGPVTGAWQVGGLIGYNLLSRPIMYSYSTGSVVGGESIGGFVGENWYSPINSCYATGDVTGESGIGGLVGRSIDECESIGGGCISPIVSCWATGDVTGSSGIGGLVGEHSGAIDSCYASGSVTATGDYVGGLTGSHSGAIDSSYAIGSVSGQNSVGGLIGYNQWSSVSSSYASGSVRGNRNVGGFAGVNWMYGDIQFCYSTGYVSGTDYVGGFVGNNDEGIIGYSFWDTESSGIIISSGGIGLSTTKMKTRSTFEAAGWNFIRTWRMPLNDYPCLKWQMSPSYSGGAGTPEDPYWLSNPEDWCRLVKVIGDWNKCFTLTADIDLGETAEPLPVVKTKKGVA